MSGPPNGRAIATASAPDPLHPGRPRGLAGPPDAGRQIDGGSEFKGAFEEACRAAGIALYVLPPKRPQRNGGVERANGIWRYEFYTSYPLPTTIRERRPLVRWWEQVYNLLRPHQALKHRTPAEYLCEAGYEVPIA